VVRLQLESSYQKRLQRTQRQYELKCAEGVHWSDADLLKSSECSTGPRLCIFLGPDLRVTGNLAPSTLSYAKASDVNRAFCEFGPHKVPDGYKFRILSL